MNLVYEGSGPPRVESGERCPYSEWAAGLRTPRPGLVAAQGVEVTGLWEGCPGKVLDLPEGGKRERLGLIQSGGTPPSEPALLPGVPYLRGVIKFRNRT